MMRKSVSRRERAVRLSSDLRNYGFGNRNQEEPEPADDGNHQDAGFQDAIDGDEMDIVEGDISEDEVNVREMEGLHKKLRQLARGFSNSPQLMQAFVSDFSLRWNQSIEISIRGLPKEEKKEE